MIFPQGASPLEKLWQFAAKPFLWPEKYAKIVLVFLRRGAKNMRILFIDIDTLRPDHMGCYG